MTLADGAPVEAMVYRRPSGSRVKASYFLAVLPGKAAVQSVEARAADGTVIATERSFGMPTWRCPG